MVQSAANDGSRHRSKGTMLKRKQERGSRQTNSMRWQTRVVIYETIQSGGIGMHIAIFIPHKTTIRCAFRCLVTALWSPPCWVLQRPIRPKKIRSVKARGVYQQLLVQYIQLCRRRSSPQSTFASGADGKRPIGTI